MSLVSWQYRNVLKVTGALHCKIALYRCNCTREFFSLLHGSHAEFADNIL